MDWVVAILVIAFYTCGAFGFIQGETRELYTSLAPLVLLSSLLILCIYDRSSKRIKALIYILSVVIVNFDVELLGVTIGVIFGKYGYGTSLGSKAAGTPLLISISWIFLVYATAAIQVPLGRGVITMIVIPILLMLGYDAITEQVAPMMQTWPWEGGSIPLQNYPVWRALAGLFHIMKYWLRINFRNRVAPFVSPVQTLLFSVILAL